jgi:hypothetical protein
MSDLTQLSEDDLRAALFEALVERFDAKAVEDTSIAVVNRMPTAFVVSRGGNLLTLSQGMGLWLLRGDLRWKNRGRGLQTFTVGRAPIQSRLAIMPDHIEGTPEEVLDRIVALFFEWTATEEASPPAIAEPIQKDPLIPLREILDAELSPASVRPASRHAAHVPQSPPTIREAGREQPGTSAGAPPKRPSSSPRTSSEGQPTPVEVTRPTSIEQPPPQKTAEPIEAEPARPRSAPVLEPTTRPSRTYQLLFETARRELDQAKASPSGSKYCLISAGVFAALTVEAFFNDLGSRLIPSWSQLQRLDPREKAEVLNMELFNEKVDWSVRPFQSVAAAFGFRRALAHAHAETLSLDQPPPFERKDTEVPRTRRTAWQEHFDDATIQQWITDVRLLIEHFLRNS